MNRREMIQAAVVALAAIPVVGWLVGPIAATTYRPIRLGTVRDFLLPGILQFRDNIEIELDIHIDYVNDCLLVKGYNFSKKQLLAFAITRSDIETNRYKAQFGPNVCELVNALRYGLAPHGVVA